MTHERSKEKYGSDRCTGSSFPTVSITKSGAVAVCSVLRVEVLGSLSESVQVGIVRIWRRVRP